jgi:hypothetical protein
MPTYSKTSPYYSTQQFGRFLDVLVPRSIPKNTSDTTYVIDSIYEYKPQLLAYDLYDDPTLWWVFASRNPNVLVDPLFDFTSGTTIFLPTKNTLTVALGL